jgi:predicted DsbA family dithiol-disulfide isomerase
MSAQPTAPIRIDYYTDPLCCWSWALEPVWRSIRRRHGTQLEWRTVLGGMIENWSTYRDPVNDVHRPMHMAAVWHFAGKTAGVPIDPSIWHVDPPASSFPASLAVKAAALQGVDHGDAYLAHVREAAMLRRMNIARTDVLCELAGELATLQPEGFDAERFAEDLGGAAAKQAFAADLQRVHLLRIGRFPTFVVHGPDGSRIAVGYRPVEVIESLIDAVVTGGEPLHTPPPSSVHTTTTTAR